MYEITDKMSFAMRKKINKKYFEDNIAPLRPNWYKIEKSSLEVYSKASQLEAGLHKNKPKEINHALDPYGRTRRFKWGPLCEAACKELYHTLSTFDTSSGDSTNYKDADFKKLGVGVKSAQFGNCAMVYQEPRNPEIIMSYTDDGEFYICGLATKEVLVRYSSVDRVNDTRAVTKLYNPKTGFYGYDKLIPLHDYLTLDKLKTLLKED